MRLAILIRDLDYGGAQRQVVTLACALRDRGVPACVIVFYAGGALEEELHERGVPTHVLGKRGRWDVVPFLFRLSKVLRRERPEVLCSFLVLENILAALARPLLPGCRIAWGVLCSDMDFSRYDWLLRFTARVESTLSRTADVIVTNSTPGRDVAEQRGFPKDRLVVVPNGFDTDRFRPDAIGGQRVRRELRIPEAAPLVGIVARLDPMKDHDTFLRAAARIARLGPDIRFACFGNGSAATRARLEKVAADLGIADRVTWCPARVDMPAVYSSLSVLVSSSGFGEGLSNALGEAMACGVPCVVTDVGDSAFVVGGEGIVVARGDDAAIAAGVARLLELRADGPALGQRVRGRIEREFGLDQLVARTLAAVGHHSRR